MCRTSLRSWRLEQIALVVIALVLTYQLFVEPIVGVADNRDYYRVMRQIGLSYRADPEATIFQNIQRKFLVGTPSDIKYLTSVVPIGHLAVWLNGLVSKDGLFDIRMMGLVNGLLYLGAIGVLLASFRQASVALRLFVATVSVVVFTDVRLVAYFNSFFSESAQLVFLVATIAVAQLIVRRPWRKTSAWLLYAGLCIVAVLFCIAKHQDIVFCLPLSLLAYRLMPRERWSRAAGLMASGGFLGLMAWAILSDAYGDTKHMNIKVILNEEILVHSPNPQQDKKELAITGNETHGFVRIATFYLRHRDRWGALAKRRMEMTFDYIPFGNFEKPLSGMSQAFDVWSEWKRKHYPRSIGFWSSALAGYALLLSHKWFTIDGSRNRRNQTLLHALLAVSCLLQFVVVSTFEANGPKKHFFIFNTLVDFVTLFAVIDLTTIVRWWMPRVGWRIVG